MHKTRVVKLEAQEKLHGPVTRGLESGRGMGYVSAAMHLAECLPVYTDELVTLVNARAGESEYVAGTLARMSRRSELAWELFHARLTTPGDPSRESAILSAKEAEEERVALILDAALDDPDVDIALAAMRTITWSGRPIDPVRVERVVEVALRRPELRNEVVQRVTSTNALTELLREMLRSGDAWQRARALQQIAIRGEAAASLTGEVDAVDPATLDAMGVLYLEEAKAVLRRAGADDEEE